jgi:hypothetical protein
LPSTSTRHCRANVYFAATDAHADIVVNAIKKAFVDAYGEIDDAAVVGIG